MATMNKNIAHDYCRLELTVERHLEQKIRVSFLKARNRGDDGLAK